MKSFFFKIRLLANFISNMGMRYILFRTLYIVQTKLGIHKAKFPLNPPLFQSEDIEGTFKTFVDKAPWKKPDKKSPLKEDNYERYQSSEWPFFSSFWMKVDSEAWLTHPKTGYRYNADLHWSLINDFDANAGDIKYVWERARFSWIYELIRIDFHRGKDSFQFIKDQIHSFLDHNPINQGPNYKCSQEISLRCINWCFFLWYYKDDIRLEADFIGKVYHALYWQWKHVCDNISFSRIAVRNNHAITETLFIYLGALWFPDFDPQGKWKSKGKQWFEEEIAYQIYADGTYLQFSMNYHRVVVQLLNLAIRSTHAAEETFSNVVYERSKRSLEFLYQAQVEEHGYLPNYGANDGALFFPMSECSYRDFSPSLNALFQSLSGNHLYENESAQEEGEWFKETKLKLDLELVRKEFSHFDKGGYIICRNEDALLMLRCGNHKDRPSQADNLHLDFWYKGQNLLLDGGSFEYNTTQEKQNYYSGTASHNTLMIGDQNQMFKGGRFIWFFWTQVNDVKVAKDKGVFEIEAIVKAFNQLDKSNKVCRKVMWDPESKAIEVWDTFEGKKGDMQLKQLWHYPIGATLNFQSDALQSKDSLQNYSVYYGKEENCQVKSFLTKGKSIKTILNYK
ncbi:heparinase II/III family protein [Cecembia lonarensis]|uniref:Uncharacterized protein n=1 Tax=Cecembia lonarensis (strain CCUG 58316 / KCTC 22772 / LW9) TaxID=1225176 RepID=K1LDY5_CECL9|nr:heparinase II/III-family protein [Cecembia lonarensis]EKB48603.1 hypothetical protein B879_02761 [Cecembia lonarensis LW9]